MAVDRFAPKDPSDVALFSSPWVSGTRAAAYFGPISAELFVADVDEAERCESWEQAEHRLICTLRGKAFALGANTVVGIETTLDPFAVSAGGRVGLRLEAKGTAARLEPLI